MTTLVDRAKIHASALAEILALISRRGCPQLSATKTTSTSLLVLPDSRTYLSINLLFPTKLAASKGKLQKTGFNRCGTVKKKTGQGHQCSS